MSTHSLTDTAAPGVATARPRDLPAWTEHVEQFGPERSLVGVVTTPVPGRCRRGGPAFVFITAGMVHRVGPNRLYVNLAHRLAEAGLVSVRFDLSGIGDSQHRSDGLPSDQSAVLECAEVMNAMRMGRGSETFVLLGLCSGAVTAFRTAMQNSRVVGAVLLNPQGFDHDAAWNSQVENRREARQYVSNAMQDPARWRRALSGRINYRRLLGVVAQRVADFGGRGTAKSPVAAALAGDFQTLGARGARLLVICSDGDASVDYMTTILGRNAFRDHGDGSLMLRLFARTDHSLTVGASQQKLFDLVIPWAGGFQS